MAKTNGRTIAIWASVIAAVVVFLATVIFAAGQLAKAVSINAGKNIEQDAKNAEQDKKLIAFGEAIVELKVMAHNVQEVRDYFLGDENDGK